MTDLSNIKSETWEELAIEKVRACYWIIRKTASDMGQTAEALGEFLEKYDEWKQDREDREDREDS